MNCELRSRNRFFAVLPSDNTRGFAATAIVDFISFFGISPKDSLSLLKNQSTIAQQANRSLIVTNEENRPRLPGHFLDLSQTLSLKSRIANCQNLIHEQNLGVQMGRHSKCQPNIHAAGVMLDRSVQEFLYFGESNDCIKFPTDLCAAHAKNGTIEKDVV